MSPTDTSETGKVPELVSAAVASARQAGSILDIERTARRIARASGAAAALDAIAEALLREGVRQRVAIDMNHRRPAEDGRAANAPAGAARPDALAERTAL